MSSAGVIFLDCDGVLCNARSQLHDFQETDDTLVHHPTIPPLEKRCIAALRRIAHETGAGIVLTTTWRLIPENRAFLVQALEAADCKVVGDTPDLGCCGRGSEVAAWLREHPDITHFVVLEDDAKHLASFSDVLPPGTWLQTVMRDEAEPLSEGITEEKATTAINILLSREEAAIRMRTKFDPETGGFLRFPGLTVVCNMPGSDEGPLAQLPLALAAQPILSSCFSPLPPLSYHCTVLDIICQYKKGLNDRAFSEFLTGDVWATAAKELVDAAILPRLRPKPGGLFVSSSVIGMELIPVGDDTPVSPGDLPIAEKLVHDLNCKRQARPWHFTLAYCRQPSIFKAADEATIKAECSALEAAIHAACPSGDEPMPMEPARLCRFEDMTAFIPWDGVTPSR